MILLILSLAHLLLDLCGCLALLYIRIFPFFVRAWNAVCTQMGRLVTQQPAAHVNRNIRAFHFSSVYFFVEICFCLFFTCHAIGKRTNKKIGNSTGERGTKTRFHCCCLNKLRSYNFLLRTIFIFFEIVFFFAVRPTTIGE